MHQDTGDDLVRLVEALGQLRDQGVTTNYNRMYAAALDGVIPVHRVGGRLYLAKSDFPAVAEWARRPVRRRTPSAA